MDEQQGAPHNPTKIALAAAVIFVLLAAILFYSFRYAGKIGQQTTVKSLSDSEKMKILNELSDKTSTRALSNEKKTSLLKELGKGAVSSTALSDSDKMKLLESLKR